MIGVTGDADVADFKSVTLTLGLMVETLVSPVGDLGLDPDCDNSTKFV
jgi:hypothetical protein